MVYMTHIYLGKRCSCRGWKGIDGHCSVAFDFITLEGGEGIATKSVKNTEKEREFLRRLLATVMVRSLEPSALREKSSSTTTGSLPPPIPWRCGRRPVKKGGGQILFFIFRYFSRSKSHPALPRLQRRDLDVFERRGHVLLFVQAPVGGREQRAPGRRRPRRRRRRRLLLDLLGPQQRRRRRRLGHAAERGHRRSRGGVVVGGPGIKG